MSGLFGSTISRVVVFGHFWISDFGQPQEMGIGGSNEDRTRYLIVANDALSQMSYGPVFWLAVIIISLFSIKINQTLYAEISISISSCVLPA